MAVMAHKAETRSERETTKEQIADRIEGLTHYGSPTCDRCRELAPDDRPATANYSPEVPVRYVAADETRLCDFTGKTLCTVHDTEVNRPDNATHRVVTEIEYIGDNHRMNSAHRSHVTQIETLENHTPGVSLGDSL